MIAHLENTFTNIYTNNVWSMGQNDSKSGLGSTLMFTENIRKELVKIIADKKISKMLDTSCGDWFWMKLIQNDLCEYTGIDIVNEIIQKNNTNFSNDKTKFINCDFLSYIKTLPDKYYDLVFCRHTLEHLPSEYNIEVLNECKRVSKYLLVTGYNIIDIKNTELINNMIYRPINIELTPYSDILLPYFVEKIYDGPLNEYKPEMYIYLFYFDN